MLPSGPLNYCSAEIPHELQGLYHDAVGRVVFRPVVLKTNEGLSSVHLQAWLASHELLQLVLRRFTP